MNIRETKQAIKDALEAYRARDKYGSPIIPVERQRPIYIEGAPGIGKTAIMKQIAEELEIPLVSYSMTHHTRQSAMGLPYIEEAEFEGVPTRVTKYTMSEIIATIYHAIEASGSQEGILFLDEINCVSETLSPVMLQFLQSKEFGGHRVPDGWIIVTAGNPVEYNESAREFDVVTLDRLSHISVEPDYNVWREFAVSEQVFPAVLSYLDTYKDDFCRIETTVDGKQFVTPRSWMDLSEMMRYYDETGKEINLSLIARYIQSRDIAKRFTHYYDLWRKYRAGYEIPQILAGNESEDVHERAKNARFDERVALVGLLGDGITRIAEPVINQQAMLAKLEETLKQIRKRSAEEQIPFKTALSQIADEHLSMLDKKRTVTAISTGDEYTIRTQLDVLKDYEDLLSDENDFASGYDTLKHDLDIRRKHLKKDSAIVGSSLDNLFSFADDVLGDSSEMVLLVTELTSSPVIAGYIATYGSDAYARHAKVLNFRARNLDLLKEIDSLGA